MNPSELIPMAITYSVIIFCLSFFPALLIMYIVKTTRKIMKWLKDNEQRIKDET